MEEVKEVKEEKEEVTEPEDLSSILSQEEEVKEAPPEEEKPETTAVKEPEEKEEKKDDIPDSGKSSVEAKGDEKKEEKPPEVKEDIPWEKRYKDTQESYKQMAITTKGVSAELTQSRAEVKHLTEQLETVHKEVFPGKEMPKVEVVKEPDADPEVALYATRVKDSEVLVMTVYSDYKEVVGEKDSTEAPYLKAVAEDPSLWNRVRSAVNPALEAYRIGKTFLEQEKYGKTPEEMKERIREEVKAEIAAELAEKKEPQKPERKKVPTLRDVDNKGTGSIPPEEESLSAILGGR